MTGVNGYPEFTELSYEAVPTGCSPHDGSWRRFQGNLLSRAFFTRKSY